MLAQMGELRVDGLEAFLDGLDMLGKSLALVDWSDLETCSPHEAVEVEHRFGRYHSRTRRAARIFAP